MMGPEPLWTRTIRGGFRYKIDAPDSAAPFPMYRWRVSGPDGLRGGSGSSASLSTAKRDAQKELDRFVEYVRGKQ